MALAGAGAPAAADGQRRGPMVVLGGLKFLMSEAPLYGRRGLGGLMFLISEVLLYGRRGEISYEPGTPVRSSFL